MATYYIGADVQSNNTELAIEQRGKIVATYSVPTTIIAISTVLDSLQGRKIFAMEEVPMAGWLYRNDAPKEFEKLLALSLRLLAQQTLAGVSTLRYQSCPGKELAATLTDMESMAYLGRYYADKIRGAADLAIFRADKNRRKNRQDALRHFTNAVKESEAYARVATSQYKPQLFSRCHYMDWWKILEEVKRKSNWLSKQL